MESATIESNVATVGLHQIKPSDVALRSVDKASEDYLQLVQSVIKNGILNPVLVSDLGEGVYGLIDGLHRYTAAKDAGLKTMPVLIKNLADSELMEAQIITNLHKVETKPMDYTKQLYRLLSANPLMTISDLADKLSTPYSWLSQRLSLTNLDKGIQDLVNEGQIGLSNAYALAKLPIEEQAEYVDRAMTDAPQSFVPVVHARVKQIKDANKKGKDSAPAEFVAIPKFQSKAAIETELSNFVVGPTVIADEGASTPEEIFKAALRWCMSLHKAGIQEQKQRYEQRLAQREEAKAKAKAEREKKKQEEAAAKAADIANL